MKTNCCQRRPPDQSKNSEMKRASRSSRTVPPALPKSSVPAITNVSEIETVMWRLLTVTGSRPLMTVRATVGTMVPMIGTLLPEFRDAERDDERAASRNCENIGVDDRRKTATLRSGHSWRPRGLLVIYRVFVPRSLAPDDDRHKYPRLQTARCKHQNRI